MFDLVTAHDFYAMLVEDFDNFMAEPHYCAKGGALRDYRAPSSGLGMARSDRF